MSCGLALGNITSVIVLPDFQRLLQSSWKIEVFLCLINFFRAIDIESFDIFDLCVEIRV